MCLKFHFAKNVQQSVLYCFDKVEGSLKNRLSGFQYLHYFEKRISSLSLMAPFIFWTIASYDVSDFIEETAKGKFIPQGMVKKRGNTPPKIILYRRRTK